MSHELSGKNGDVESRTPGLLIADLALYHWATSPDTEYCIVVFIYIPFNWTRTWLSYDNHKSMGNMSCPEKMEILGIEPEAFWLRIRHSTTELHPLIQNITFCLIGPEQDFNMTNLKIHGRHELTQKNGDARGRTQGLLIADQTLYHWATSPDTEHCIVVFTYIPLNWTRARF